MKNGPAHPALQALARECAVPLTSPTSLHLRHGDGGEAIVQTADDGALLMHARWPWSVEGVDDSARAWTRLLVRNAPLADQHPLVHAVDAARQEIVAFARLQQADQQPPHALRAWAQACLAQLVNASVANASVANEPVANESIDPAFAAPAHDEEAFAALWRALGHDHDLPEEDPDQPLSWTLVPDDGVPVRLSWHPTTGEVLLRAIVSVLPTAIDDDAPYFQRLLGAHLFGEQTSGSVFAIDEDEAELIVWHRESVARLSADELSCLLGHVSALALSFAPGADNDSRRACHGER